MRYFLSIIGIIGAYFLLRYRERVGDLIGEADWMNKVGGVYNLIIFCAVLLFFWSIAELTGTTDALFSPLLYLFPGTHQAVAP
ncbi:MAG: hypothetical protein PHW10_03575 [Candidatus Peribacteraceae bacterium]|nr:hypothetical protein [Candidatus Peribacteraceae bacterium]